MSQKESELPEIIEVKDRESEPVEEDTSRCPICYDSWSSSGSHRVCALKCGHLFGKSCILSWIDAKKGSFAKCPQCNGATRKKDIRDIYAVNIKCLDTSERDDAIKQMIAERDKRISSEKLCSSLISQHQYTVARLNEQITRLQQELVSYKANARVLNGLLGNTKSENTSSAKTDQIFPVNSRGEFVFLGTKYLCQTGDCRVGIIIPDTGIVLVGKPSSNSVIYPGHGLSKIHLTEFSRSNSHVEFYRVHQATIRDIDIPRNCGQNVDYVLTASMDKSLCVTNPHAQVITQRFSLTTPLWSCCYDALNTNLVYCGSANGCVYAFDVRNPATDDNDISRPLFSFDPVRCGFGGAGPVVSIKPVLSSERSTGVFVTCLKSAFFINSLDASVILEGSQQISATHNVRKINYETIVDGVATVVQDRSQTFISSAVASDMTQISISSRPSSFRPSLSHQIGVLSVDREDETKCRFAFETSCNGGKKSSLLTRSTFLNMQPGSPRLFLSPDEESSSVLAWDSFSGERTHCIPSSAGTVLDVFSGSYSGSNYVFLLSGTSCSLYRHEYPVQSC